MQSKSRSGLALQAAIAGALISTTASAVDFTSGDWKFSVDGNVNADYIYSSCQSAASAEPIVTVGGACTGSSNGSSVSNVGNGLLPAAITFGISTTQAGYDISAHFGLYPGISTNDGGSPNLQVTPGAASGLTNTALGTTGLDVRQVYLTFGNKDIGTFTFGRNFGLFGFDAIVNDMTLPGVGVAGAASTAAPANTSLGSIGFGYIYTDTLAQMNYTTPDFAGFNVTVGIFDPINSLTDSLSQGDALPKKAPGFHGKASYTAPLSGDMKLYLSATFITQKQDYQGTGGPVEYTGTGGDFFAKFDLGNFEFDGSYYTTKGLGTTGLFVLGDYQGSTRKSDGYLVQATYKFDALKVGVNYGVSQLDFANAADAAATPNLLDKNSKVTGGLYYSLTKNLTLLGEVSSVKTQAHNGFENKSTDVNAGAYLSF